MLSRQEIEDVVSRISYRDWEVGVVDDGPNLYIQTKDPKSPVFGRMWLIEPRHDQSDVVRTIFAAISLIEEHERREFFLLDGVPVWNPHDPVV